MAQENPQEQPPVKTFTITLPSLKWPTIKMNADAITTFTASALTALLPLAVKEIPQLADWLPLISDFCNTASKDLAILGGALHLDGK
jgi:hypothetical protein